MELRKSYDKDLARIKTQVEEMGLFAEAALARALAALKSHDPAAARRVMEEDEEINRREKELGHLCMALLLRQQPVAADLRRVSSALKLATDLERMGDHAADIAQMSLELEEDRPLPPVLEEMGRTALEMERAALEAFLEENPEKAARVEAGDDRQDALFEQAKRELAEQIAACPDGAGQVLSLLMVAKYLERVSDHAVNLARWAEFCCTGCYRGSRMV